MKIIYKLIVFISIALFFSCEDVVEVDLNNEIPRLVIDASIKWQKGTSGNEQVIKLTTTTPYFSNIIPVVNGATIFIVDSQSNQYDFVEQNNSGNYVCSNFNPIIGETYTLTVFTNGQTYKATEKLYACPVIQSTEQKNDGGFTGDAIEVKFFFNDFANEDNFYLFKTKSSHKVLPEYTAVDDQFFQGNQMFEYYSDEDLKTGDVLDFTLHGISEKYHNYMNILIGITGNSNGSPFTAPPATVRGNIVNQTNFDNYPLGFFHLSEIDKMSYTVE